MTEQEQAIIRRAEERDLAPVAEIYEKILAREAEGLVQTGWLPGVYPVEATARAALKRKDLFVCELDGTVVASAILNQMQVDAYRAGNWHYPARDGEVMVLHTLTVDPEAGRRGIGTQFVHYYEQYALSHGCPILRMDTNEKNRRVRELYRRLGYREAGIVPCDFNGIPDVGLVLLEKRIGPPETCAVTKTGAGNTDKKTVNLSTEV